MNNLLSTLSFFLTVLGIMSKDVYQPYIMRTIIGVAFIVMVVSIIKNIKDAKNEKWQEQQKNKIRTIANAEIYNALGELMHPFDMAYDNINYLCNNKLENTNRDDLSRLLNPDFICKCKLLNLREHPENPSFFPSLIWTDFFERNAKRFDVSVDRILAKYSMYVDADVIIKINSIKSQIFYMWILDFRILVDANSHLEQFNFDFLIRCVDAREFSDFILNIKSLKEMVQQM